MSTDTSPATTAVPENAAAPPVDGRRWWTLAVVCVATFMLLLDVTIVNVALPNIAGDLGSSFSDLQWVIDAYALGLAALLLTWGSVADLVGRKRVFIGGLLGFALASGLCAASTDPLLLNLARGLQGLVAAAMFATSLALLAATFTGRERGTAFGVWGATTGAAVAVGPLVGGVLIEIASWHWIFLINVPIGLVAALVGWRTITESRDPDARRVDVPGVITFSAALVALIFGLVRGNAEGWGSTLIVSLLAGAGVLLVLFVIVQVRSRRGMLDLALFRVPAFTGASIAAFGLSAAMFSLFLYITLYLQNVLGFSALESGLRLLPTSALAFLVAPIAGRMSAVVPTRFLIGGGLLLVSIGLFLMRAVDGSREWTDLLPGLIVAGVGIGLTNPPLASTAIGVVAQARSGMASGINNTFRQVGIATGTAAFGAIFASLVESELGDAVRERAGAAAAAQLPPGDVLAQGQAATFARFPGGEAVFVDAWTSTFSTVLLVASAVALASALLAVVLIRPKDFARHDAPGGAPGAGAEAEAAPTADAKTTTVAATATDADEDAPADEVPVAAPEPAPAADRPVHDAWAVAAAHRAQAARPLPAPEQDAPSAPPAAGAPPVPPGTGTPGPPLGAPSTAAEPPHRTADPEPVATGSANGSGAPSGPATGAEDTDATIAALRLAVADARAAAHEADRRERARTEREADRRRAEMLADVASATAERHERIDALERRVEELVGELARRAAIVREHETALRETRGELWRLVAELHELAPEGAGPDAAPIAPR